MPKVWDIIVVGAGPAGSTAAKFLAEAGVDVLLVDKAKFPRDKPCGGGILPIIFKKFQYLNDHKNELVEKTAENIKISIFGNSFEISDKELFYITSRYIFDNILLNITKSSEVQFKKQFVSNVRISKNFVKIITKKGEILSKAIIGADGVNSVVAKCVYPKRDPSKYFSCLLGEVKLDSNRIDRLMKDRKVPCTSYFRGTSGAMGYGWVYPRDGFLNMGVASPLLERRTSSLFVEYISSLRNTGIPTKFSKKMAATSPFYMPEKTYDSRILLCGDAGLFSDTLYGEGISNGMVSGKCAAQALIKALEADDLSARSLSIYENFWKKELFKKFKVSMDLRNFLLEYNIPQTFLESRLLKNMIKEYFTSENAHYYLFMVLGEFFKILAKYKKE